MKSLAGTVCLCLYAGVALAGPTTGERKSQFEKALSAVIASITPDASKSVRDSLIEGYENGKDNRAMAVQPTYRSYFSSELHEDEEMAGDRTLEACQLRFAVPCALIAINDEIVIEGQPTLRPMSRLLYAGSFDLSKIPVISQATRYRADVQKYLNTSGPKAIAIHPRGTLFIAFGSPNAKDAQEAALTKCNTDFVRAMADGPCFLYAVGDTVVLPERHTKPQ